MASDDGLTLADGLTTAAVQQMTQQQLLDLVDDMRADWAFFNQILNTMATSFGWCGEFEDRMERYNTETKVLKMQGRNPKGTYVSTRDAYAARRMSMAHVMTTCQRFGVDMPAAGMAGVIADHGALDEAHISLSEHLSAATASMNKQE